MGFSTLFLLLTLAEVGFGQITSKISKADFPSGFVFGSGTSAYQVEGAASEDGRTPSVWDTVVHAGKMRAKGNGDIACDQYHKYKEDVQLMVDTGLDAYRFSISWSRLLPYGRGAVNPKGLQYYNNLINELLKHGIQPHVTLFHYDLPQILEDEYGGWLSQKIVKDFKEYANTCFREFGDRVSYWTTLNEPNVLALGGYDTGNFPPLRCSYPFGRNCIAGDSTTEPYIVAHNMLLAHAAAATLYKTRYQAKQHGFIGLNVFVYWFLPLTNSTEDVAATQRAHDLFTGWFVNPLVFGDYPDSLKKNAVTKIPSFTKQQSKYVMGSFDFFGVNHYATMYVQDSPSGLKMDQRDCMADMSLTYIAKRGEAAPGEFPIFPSGLQQVLGYFKDVYANQPIYIQENGYPMPSDETLNDTQRVKYLSGFIGSLLNAVRNGSNAKGYFTWSFMDLFELLNGYESGYGLYNVDFGDKDLIRYPKLSAHWYSNFLKGSNGVPIESSATSPTLYSVA